MGLQPLSWSLTSSDCSIGVNLRELASLSGSFAKQPESAVNPATLERKRAQGTCWPNSYFQMQTHSSSIKNVRFTIWIFAWFYSPRHEIRWRHMMWMISLEIRKYEPGLQEQSMIVRINSIWCRLGWNKTKMTRFQSGQCWSTQSLCYFIMSVRSSHLFLLVPLEGTKWPNSLNRAVAGAPTPSNCHDPMQRFAPRLSISSPTRSVYWHSSKSLPEIP